VFQVQWSEFDSSLSISEECLVLSVSVLVTLVTSGVPTLTAVVSPFLYVMKKRKENF